MLSNQDKISKSATFLESDLSLQKASEKEFNRYFIEDVDSLSYELQILVGDYLVLFPFSIDSHFKDISSEKGSMKILLVNLQDSHVQKVNMPMSIHSDPWKSALVKYKENQIIQVHYDGSTPVLSRITIESFERIISFELKDLIIHQAFSVNCTEIWPRGSILPRLRNQSSPQIFQNRLYISSPNSEWNSSQELWSFDLSKICISLFFL